MSNLPTQLTSFVGREAELAELGQAFKAARLVTLTGAGGCGKTRLALHAVAEVAERHPDGAWWIELAPVSAGEFMPYVVARTFGLVEEPGRPVVDTLSEQLAGLDALVVLDNCEHLLEPCTRLVDALLRAAPALRFVTTSREPLGVPGELTWRVPSLDEEAGVRLFVERAALVRPGFTAEGGDATVVAQICRRLDGLPLAIELAAARARMMPPAGIAAALDDRFRLLTGGGMTMLPRQQTLETSVAWSYDLLDDAERALLRRLSVFAGGFTRDAAESVCADEILDRYAVLDVLSHLVDKSLVHADVDQAEGRYGLLETIRVFARSRLMSAGESSMIQERHRDFFLALAEQAEPELAMADDPPRGWIASSVNGITSSPPLSGVMPLGLMNRSYAWSPPSPCSMRCIPTSKSDAGGLPRRWPATKDPPRFGPGRCGGRPTCRFTAAISKQWGDMPPRLWRWQRKSATNGRWAEHSTPTDWWLPGCARNRSRAGSFSAGASPLARSSEITG